MPELPGGLKLAIDIGALFDHGGNWFACPPGHFWYWVPDPKINPPPFDPRVHKILHSAEHAPAPRNRKEVKRFIRVLEMLGDGEFLWRGEWLSSFPKFMTLDEADRAVWEAWVDSPQNQRYLDAAIAECQRLADLSAQVSGLPHFTPVEQPDG